MSWGVFCPAPFTSLPVELWSDTAVGAMGVLQEQGLLQRCFMSLALTSGHVQPQVQCEADFVDEPLNSYCSFFTQWSVIYAKKDVISFTNNLASDETLNCGTRALW